MKKAMALVAALVMLATAGAAHAATFTYSLSSTFRNDQTLVGSGTFEASDAGAGDGSWNITGATGSFTTDPGSQYETVHTILEAPVNLWRSKQTFTMGRDGVTSVDFALRTKNNYFTLVGKGSASSRFTVFLGEVGGPMTLSILPVSAGAVPEPATWGLMLVGFGAAGVALRRRKSMDRFATA